MSTRVKRGVVLLTAGHTCCPDDPTCPWNGGWVVYWPTKQHRYMGRNVDTPQAGEKARPPMRVRRAA